MCGGSFRSSSNTLKHLFSGYETTLLNEEKYIFPLLYGVLVCLPDYYWLFYCPPNRTSQVDFLSGYS